VINPNVKNGPNGMCALSVLLLNTAYPMPYSAPVTRAISSATIVSCRPRVNPIAPANFTSPPPKPPLTKIRGTIKTATMSNNPCMCANHWLSKKQTMMPVTKNIPTKKLGISMVIKSIMAMHMLVVMMMKYKGTIAPLKKNIEAIATKPQAISAATYKKENGFPHTLQRPFVRKYPKTGIR